MFGAAIMCESYLQYLVDHSVLNEMAALDILDQQKNETPPIGRLALETRVLSMKQVFKVLGDQAESELRFGELAISLGYMNEEQLVMLLDLQRTKRPGINEIILKMELADKETLERLRQEFLDNVSALVN